MNKSCQLVVIFIILFFSGYSQNTYYSSLQSVIPSAPESIALNRVSFSDVNLYTGKLNYNIPLYTITQNNLNVAIALAYIGGGGIKVEEVASCAGLGWSLSSTGVISRVTRGLADDVNVGNYIGYMHLPDFPAVTVENVELYKKYAQNQYDGEPDLYNLSFSNLSAQFYINKNKKVVFVEKSDMQIIPVFNENVLTSFKVTDINGKMYFFEERELVKRESIGTNVIADFNDYTTSSWYLTKIVSEYGKEMVNYNYQSAENNNITQLARLPYQYKLESAIQPGSVLPNQSSFYNNFYKRPILQKITFDAGEVDFIMSDSTRYDLSGEKNIKGMIVKNNSGDTIKKITFDYSYFSDNGIIQESQAGLRYGYGNTHLRLKLDALHQISATEGQLSYKFVYDTAHYLPDGESSFAVDHWGFYNGVTENTVWEAKNRIKYYFKQPNLFASLDSFYAENGTADREPNAEYAKAAVLTKVITPTGGELRFEYELNRSSYSKLRNNITRTSITPNIDNTKNYFNVNLINEPFGYVDISAEVDFSSYSYEYIIRDSLDTKTFAFDTLIRGDAHHTYKLGVPGKYYIKVRLIGSHPDPDYYYSVRLQADSEVLVINKPVGGIRIKSMESFDSLGNTVFQRKFFYNESGDTSSTSLSTGEVASVPSYSHQRLELFSSDYIPNYFSVHYLVPQGYVRLLTSAYPIGVTSGSFVGYRKVTTVDANALKTESYFTSFTDFPEYSNGYYPDNDEDGSLNGITISGEKYETTPLTPFDERDYLRGKLTKKIIFEKINNQFRKIEQQENIYQFNMGIRLSKLIMALPDTCEIIKGMIFNFIPLENNAYGIQFKKYNRYTSKYDIKKTIEKHFSYTSTQTDSLVNETTFYYEDSPWYKDSLFHYQPTKTTTVSSNGNVKTNQMYYPYHWRYTIGDIDQSDKDHMRILDSSNRIAIPILQIITDSSNNTHIESVKRNYAPFDGINQALQAIQIKLGGANGFEKRVVFNNYDTYGNLQEQQKVNDVKHVYLWGYNSSYPVAEILNADYSTVNSIVSQAAIDAATNGVSDDNSVRSLLNNIRTGLSGTKALVTTYTYKPLVGMTSQTYPSGHTTYYEYDGFNRLKLIRDKDNNIIKKFDYKYAGQSGSDIITTTTYYSTVLSGTFQKSNCSSGLTGSSVTYTVAAGAYTSTVSQQDADNQAIADVNANGQAYANNNGTCTYVCSTGNCTGAAYKCINGLCELGVKVYTSSVKTGVRSYTCTYHYEWSDGSWSSDYTEQSSMNCAY